MTRRPCIDMRDNSQHGVRRFMKKDARTHKWASIFSYFRSCSFPAQSKPSTFLLKFASGFASRKSSNATSATSIMFFLISSNPSTAP